MHVVSLEVLKKRLSECVLLASQGERVLITDGDQIVAELVPPNAGRAEHVSDAVPDALVRDGLMTPPLAPGRPLVVPHPRGEKLSDVLAALAADRDER